jgi:hypothetical protein
MYLNQLDLNQGARLASDVCYSVCVPVMQAKHVASVCIYVCMYMCLYVILCMSKLLCIRDFWYKQLDWIKMHGVPLTVLCMCMSHSVCFSYVGQACSFCTYVCMYVCMNVCTHANLYVTAAVYSTGISQESRHMYLFSRHHWSHGMSDHRKMCKLSVPEP